MTIETDIAVVGAGPCGSFSAFIGAKSGTRVAVFEEHPTVGVPAHCAGHLSISGLKRLGLRLPSFLVENTFRGVVFFSPSGKQFSVRFPSPVTCTINRELFDEHLANIASNAGAQFFLSSRVKTIIEQQNGAKVIVASTRGRNESIMCNMIIDAEGVSSTLLKNVGLKPFNNEMLVKAVSADVDGVRDVESDRVEVYFGSGFADGFYAWIIPKRDGTAKIGLATKRDSPKQCLERLINNHPITSSKLRKSRIMRVSYHSIPLGGPISKAYANGFLAIGDAASQVKPTTGGGVVMGLTCAQIAGEIASKAVKENIFSESLLKYYEEEWKQKVGHDLRAMLFARKLLNRLSDSEIDRIFATVTRLRLDETLVRVKDVDFQWKELRRLAKSPSVLVTLAYFLFSALT